MPTDEDWHAGEDEAGISQRGMERLMRALGDDGLSEMDIAALDALKGGEGEDEEGDEEGDEDEEEDEEGDEEEDKEGDQDDEEEDEGDEEEQDEEGDEDDEEGEEGEEGDGAGEDTAQDPSAPRDSLAASILRSGLVPQEEDDDEEDDEEEEEEDEDDEDGEGIALEDLPESVNLPAELKATAKSRVRINKADALTQVYEEMRLDGPSGRHAMPWIEHMAVVVPQRVADEVPDVQNDLERELAIYRQALRGAVDGRERVLAANVPFSRPADFFAEMLKTDEHMERVRQRLLDESASIKASEAAKRQRELKKYGKQIQTDKLYERQKNKRELVERVDALKRKRDEAMDDSEFDVQLEQALDTRAPRGKGRPKPKMPRAVRNERYGFGGKKRHNKSNTAESTDDFGSKSSKRSSRQPQRPGKARRARNRK